MLHRLLISMRIILTVAGALALLYTLSFPDSILPPTPALEYITGITAYTFKPYLWVLPLLSMELTAGMGSRRNFVWFTSLFGVLLVAFLAWPVVQAHYPELIHPTFEFEDGKLAVGIGWLAVIAVGSVLFRCVLLDFLFKAPERAEESDAGAVESAVLDPSTARTVREIAADPVRVRPHFLFGDADRGLIERFGILMRRLLLRRHLRTALLATAAAACLGWFFLYPQPDEEQALQRDLAAMYDYTVTPAGQMRATTPAVHAAYRVLRYVADKEAFAGFTRGQAEKWLRLQHLPDAYRRQLRDETDRPLPSVDDAFDSRTRFLTVCDGRRTAVLFIRTDITGERINIAEVQDAGWNAVMDDRRRRFGNDIDTRILSR